MKILIKYIFLFGLIVFSFYYTNKVSILMINKSQLMQTIKDNSFYYTVSSIDAIIDEDSIIPGQNGMIVNEDESYYQMRSNRLFDASKLVFKQITPSVSIENNKELIINKVRYQKKGIALVFKDNQNILNYLNDHKIIITRLVNSYSFKKTHFYEQISIDKETDVLLKKYKLDKNICFEDYIERKDCLKDGKYLVKATYQIKNSINVKEKVISGNILFIDDLLTLDDFKIILKQINYQDLKLYYLSDFISEKAIIDL